MIKKWKRFNEGFFDKRKTGEEVKPMGFKKIVKPDHMEMRPIVSGRVDPYFIQEITDRILGPDSEAYISELNELNKKYKPRLGKTGLDVL